jgi:predicted RNase H-like nuclease
MYFAGVDLAWAGRNPTGVAVVDDGGVLVSVGAVRTDDEVLAALRPWVRGTCVVGFDAPLVVINPTGQRPAEAALNRDFRRFEAGAHPSNTGKPEFAGGPRAARLAKALALNLDPYSRSQRRALEVYPHAATVALFRLPRTLKYKAKPGRHIDQLRGELLRLMDLVETLADAPVPMRVCDHADWARLREAVLGARRKSDLRRAEDPVDITIYGDAASGYIATPSLPSDVLMTRTGG